MPESSCARWLFSAPTFSEIDISLSLRITSMSGLMSPAWFMASKAIPAVMAPSPITQTVRRCLFSSRRRRQYRCPQKWRWRNGRRSARHTCSHRATGTDAGHLLTNSANFIATSGQNFVRIGLVAHVPDELIERRVIDVVQRHGQLYRAKPGGEMAAGAAYAVEQVATQLVAQLWQALFGNRRNSLVESTNASVGYLAISKLIKGSSRYIVYLSRWII